MKKKLFGFNTKTLVGTALGAALFTVLFMYVKIPTGIPETQIQSAYGIGGFFAAMFGPIAGFLIAFIGHALSDIVQYGSAWWSWVIASGVAGLIGLQAFLNIAVATGLAPNTGIPLPFVSYGLTSLVSLFGAIGIVINIGLQSKKH